MLNLVILSILAIIPEILASPCAIRSYGQNNIVCVCNSTYCDTLEPIDNPRLGQAIMYESNKAGARFSKSVLAFSNVLSEDAEVVHINRSEKFQFILGFGGAFTDAAGINIASLPLSMQNQLMSGYYSKNGLEYSMGRVPMASCDFSTHAYSYDDVADDFNLKHFKLAEEDLKYKIPYIKMAKTLSEHELLLFGSPWSAPAWMKTNNAMIGNGTLKGSPGGKYYQTWADYFVRFLQAYQKENITFWGLTAQNEPTDGHILKFAFQSMGFTPETQRDFIKLHLGPTLAKAGFGVDNIKLMIMDDVRILLPKWADVVLSDPEAAQFISGLAFHWYVNMIAPPRLLDIVNNKYPNVFLLSTEACTGSYPWQLEKVLLGSWERAESYAHDIIQDLLHWSIGWIDWNLALDVKGGPNWVKNYVDSPVIVNSTASEFYRQPMFYILGHFSKLLPPGSIRIGISTSGFLNGKNVDVAAFETPKNAIVTIIVNRESNAIPITIYEKSAGSLNITASPRSVQSYLWITSNNL